jgi:hypothetical protein
MKQFYPNKLSLKSLSLLILLSISFPLFSQNAGISATGSIPPDNSAGLDINFPTLGLLIPRVALTSTSSFAPLSAHVAGMIIYNTATTADVAPGFYFNNGTRWVPSVPKANTAGDMQYWDGNVWVTIPAGHPGQLMQINSNGVPSWIGAGYAALATSALSNITPTTAASGGNIVSDGGSPVTARGVCWATTPNPTITGSKTSDGTGTGTFISNITGLVSGTTYFLRSYATNSTGTSYGNQLVFPTL